MDRTQMLIIVYKIMYINHPDKYVHGAVDKLDCGSWLISFFSF